MTFSFGGSFSRQEEISAPVGVPAQTDQITGISGTQNVLSFPGVTIAAGRSQPFSAAGWLDFGPLSLVSIAPYIGTGTKSLSLAGTGVAMAGFACLRWKR